MDDLIKKSNLNKTDDEDWTALMVALRYNQEQKLNLTTEQWDYLIKNTDLNKTDNENWTALMFALIYNQEQNLNLTTEQLDYLIKNTDPELFNERIVNFGDNILLALLQRNAQQKIFINDNQLQYIMEHTNLSYKIANDDGENWVTLYFKNKIKEKLPDNPYILTKLFETSIENQELLNFTILQLLENNKSYGFNLKQEHFDFLISNIDFKEENNSKEILKHFFESLKEKEISFSPKSFSLLLNNLMPENDEILCSFLNLAQHIGGNILNPNQWEQLFKTHEKFLDDKKINNLIPFVKPSSLAQELNEIYNNIKIKKNQPIN
jgi:hypothetical protein